MSEQQGIWVQICGPAKTLLCKNFFFAFVLIYIDLISVICLSFPFGFYGFGGQAVFSMCVHIKWDVLEVSSLPVLIYLAASVTDHSQNSGFLRTVIMLS